MSLKRIPSDLPVSVPGYKILERLGSGTYSTVYKASKVVRNKFHFLKIVVDLMHLRRNTAFI